MASFVGADGAASAVSRVDVPVVQLATGAKGVTIPCRRILHGLWQTSGGWGTIEAGKAVDAMYALVG
jgi:hypothetical protein